MKSVIVIPTYNERNNISRLIPELLDVFETDPSTKYEILVVDGNSPDGTAEAVQELEEQHHNVHLLLEPEKRGLGAAYMYGFKHAMDELKADVVMEMDADFQHDPQDVPRLMAEIHAGADHVIGSRFVEGGTIPKDWLFVRKAISILGNLFTRFTLGIMSVNDYTTGFRATRVKGTLDSLDLDNVLSSGFAYKIDLLYRMNRMGAVIKEVPIDFGLRTEGHSKMEKNNPVDSLRVVLTLRLREFANFIKFAVVGFVGFFTDMGLFNLFMWLTSLSEVHSSNLSGFIALNVTFILNNLWSFNDRKMTQISRILRKIPLYYLISYTPIFFRSVILIPLALRYIGDTVLVANLAFVFGVGLGLIWNFLFYSRIVWRKGSYA